MMKKGMLLLLCLALLLCGCAGKNEGPIATNESQTPTNSPEKETSAKLAMGSEIWMEFPTLTYGVMEYEKLQVLPWNSGRCEATSFDSMAETALGFYMCPMNRLYYADKTDLSNWVPVCGNPDCKHLGTSCDAFVQYREFVIKGDRIYYHSMSGVDNELYSGGATMFLASMAANGSNKRLEYAPDTYVPTTYLQDMAFLTSGQYIYNVIGMNADGSATAYSYMVAASGEESIQQVEIPDADEAGSAALPALPGCLRNRDFASGTGLCTASAPECQIDPCSSFSALLTARRHTGLRPSAVPAEAFLWCPV